ncbi:MAG: hypothetical protein JXB03_02950 [Spirochaetales bacterium]|nr:hypothetical protein [Spirochaetales bacterium]
MKKLPSIPVCAVMALVMLTPAVGCRQKQDAYTIGIINGHAPFSRLVDGLKAGLAEAGYQEGTTVSYLEFPVISGSEEETKAINDLIDRKVDCIYAFPTGTALHVKKLVNGTIPAVYGLTAVENTGLVETVQKPGYNSTGVRAPSTGAVLKRLEFLAMLLKENDKVYITYNKAYPANLAVLPEVRTKARDLGIELIEEPVGTVKEIASNLYSHGKEPPFGGIMILADNFTQSLEGWQMISSFAAVHKIPVAGASLAHTQSGGVLSYASDFYETGRLGAVLVDSVLKAGNAGSIPMPTARMALYINYALAEEFGLTVPDELLHLAKEIPR